MAASARKQYRETKYAPLGKYLAKLPASTAEVILTFAEVERIVGRRLPASAREYRVWWANQKGGSRAYHWQDAGFKSAVNMTRQTVRFYRDASVAPRPLTLQEVVRVVNEGARGRPIGELQEWRKKRHGLMRSAASTVFYADVEEGRRYAFHVGGLSELQFNVGFEEADGIEMFRHGVAFSLQTTRELPDITPLVPKIARFNEYLRLYPEAFTGFVMWHWPSDDERSDNYPVVPMPDELIAKGNFIFIGRQQPADRIDVGLILDDFDRLLPLYEFAEGKETETFPSPVPESERGKFVWSSGKKPRAARASYEQEAKYVEKDLRQNALQGALFDHLEEIYGESNVKEELHTGNGTKIDIAVREGNRYAYYEIKTYLSARACIREALGQLLEYSFWPGAKEADRLVIVGEAPCDEEATAYIRKLDKKFSLRVQYRQFDMKSGRLL